MQLTKQKALELTAELWEWIGSAPPEEPPRWKHQWPRWKINGGDIQSMPYNCPCCAYAVQQCPSITPPCACCPIPQWQITTCMKPGSPYSKWLAWLMVADQGEKRLAKDVNKYARKIAMMARAALENES